MYIHGSFLDTHGREVEVRILTHGDSSEELEIGCDALSFNGNEAVVLSGEVGDTFDVLLRGQATIRLLTDRFLPTLFVGNAREGVVNVLRDGRLLFAGYIEPHTYNQPFIDRLDELDLNCIDALSALQYSRYLGVSGSDSYVRAIQEATNRSFLSIIEDALTDVAGRIVIDDNGCLLERIPAVLYDGSKRVGSTAGKEYSIFEELGVSDLLFLGDEEDDVLTKCDVLESILQYLDLHLLQDGDSFYLFSWETLRRCIEVDFADVLSGSHLEDNIHISTLPITLEMCSGMDTSITIGEVYNRLELTSEIVKIDDVIESPLESSSLYNVCRRYQHYMREWWSNSLVKFRQLVLGYAVASEGSGWTDWFIRLKGHRNWVFPGPDGDEKSDWTADYHDGLQQHVVADLLTESDRCHACIMSIGKLKYDSLENSQNSSPISSIDFTDYLCIGVNGDRHSVGVVEDSAAYADELGARFLASCPVAVYHGNKSGGVFSPTDDSTTNYIVISGNMVLNPVMPMSGTVESIRNNNNNGVFSLLPVGSRDGGRYLTRMYMRPAGGGEWDTYDSRRQDEWYPFTDEGIQLYEFKYSAVGDSTDNILKVGVLSCMLIIGDKCLVETDPNGTIDSFEWRLYKERSECANDDEYYAQSFSIGFDPKIGDKIIGVSYPIGNNVSYRLGLDAKGMAIPIRRSDHLRGKVTFKILGPYNSLWNDITRRHRTFFRREKWKENDVVLMSHVSSILIDKFEMKIYSDNGFVNIDDEHDLVYVSDTDESFVNKKDDLTFKLTSALTSEESSALQVPNTVAISTPVNMVTGDGVEQIYDAPRDLLSKPEKLYVDTYYSEYHVPRVLLLQTLEDTDKQVSYFNRYTHPALLGKEFYVQNIRRDLQAGTAELTLKER